METTNKYPEKLYIGEKDGKRIYLTSPSWDCGWYWGFGYLGNRYCHYHVSTLMSNTNLHDGFKSHFGDSFIVKDDKDIWTISELFVTFYSLKASAEINVRGGSHISENPCCELIKNKDEAKRINKVLMPAIFDEIYKILLKY